MAASRARLEALLARVQKRATEPRSPSVAVAPLLEALPGGNRGSDAPPASEPPASVAPASVPPASAPPSSVPPASAPASVRAGANAQSSIQGLAPSAAQSAIPQHAISQHAIPQNEIADEDIEEYDDDLIEIIDDAEVIPQAAAVARAIEPAAFGAAVDRRPSPPSRSEPVARAVPPKAPEPLRPETVVARPIEPTDVARVRGARRELRHRSFVELLDASLDLG